MFGSLTKSLYTHFMLITTEGWTDIANPTMDVHGSVWAVYFILFIFATNFSLLNMVVAVITERILSLGQEEAPRQQLMAEMEVFTSCVTAIFKNIDEDNSEALSPTELQAFFDDPQYRRVLQAFHVNTAMPYEYIIPIIDIDRDEKVTLEEFVTACLRLRGSQGKSNFQVLMLQCDVFKVIQMLRSQQEKHYEEIVRTMDRLEAAMQELVDNYAEQSLHQLPEIEDSTREDT